MLRFGNSDWKAALHERLARESRPLSESVSEFPIGETLSPQTATVQPALHAPQASVFASVEQMRINRRW